MPHRTGLDHVEISKPKNKIIGFEVRILDDGTFYLTMKNDDYTKNKEYSYDSFDKMMIELKKDFSNKKTEDKKEDYLSKAKK